MVDSARGGAVRAFGPRVSEGADTDSHEEASHGGDHDRTLSVLSESHLSVVHAAATRPGRVGEQRLARGHAHSYASSDVLRRDRQRGAVHGAEVWRGVIGDNYFCRPTTITF